VLLVVLRLSIGWQLLYEGLWKAQTLSTATPWSSVGYLQNAQGPLRDVFRSISGDPDDLDWLNEESVIARWDAWKTRFANHYQLSEAQNGRLNALVDGSARFVAELDALPPEVDFAAVKLDTVMSFDADKKRLVIDGKKHLLPKEKKRLEDQVSDKSGPQYDAYRDAVTKAFARSSRLSYKERLRAHLLGNPDNAGLIQGRISELELYRHLVERYDKKLASADIAFEFDHLITVQRETKSKGSDVAGPVKAMDAEMKVKAMDLLDVEQIQIGPLSTPFSTLRVVDLVTISGLIVLGALLILGLFTRCAAVSAAFMVFGFYLAMPPWPGVPEIPGPEHSFIVNKNLVEILALLALAVLPSGKWFGIDAVMGRKK
jgi:uncharacterized membrane protein YphA (DoxX/SURF4 family)